MKIISTEADYYLISAAAETTLSKKKKLPENVFGQALNFFLFITFDELFTPLFFNHIKQYLLDVGENSFWLTAIDPDPKLYFNTHFGFFGTMKFSSLDTDSDYLSALNNYPEDSPADALAHNSNLLLVSSSTCRWAIYADRNADIAICAFADRRQMEQFKSVYGSDLLDGVKTASDYAYGATGNDELKANFFSSYSGD